MNISTRILITDDHKIFREGLRRLLEEHPEFEVVAEAANGTDAVAAVFEHRPDILLLDLRLPDISGLDVMRQLSEETHHKTIMLAADIRPSDMIQAIVLGAVGIVEKHEAYEVLMRSIRSVVDGEVWISRSLVKDLVWLMRAVDGTLVSAGVPQGVTSRELEIIDAVLKGKPNRDVADRLGISEGTVKHHLTRIFRKFGVGNRVELAMSAVQHGLVRKSAGTSPDDPAE